MTMSQDTPKTKRLFVGGLFDEVTPEDLKQRFAKYGNVKSVDLKTKRNSFGDIVKTFAFMDFDSTPAKLRQCIDVFNKAKWKGRELNIQLAEDSFLDKLAKERQMQSVVKLWSPAQNKTGDNEKPHLAIQQLKVKGPPGTAITGKEGWVVGKYSQPVPVLKMKQDGGKKTVIFDPSKNCHGLKRFDKDDNLPSISFDQLTWQLEEKTLPPKAAAVKPSKRKNIQATKKVMSYDSGSATGSESEHDGAGNSFADMSARQMEDSDVESRGSCDTDEIVRRAKNRKSSNCMDYKKQEIKNSSPVSNVKSVTSNLAEIRSGKKHPLNIVAKELVFSEFSDGVSSSTDVERELESDHESIEDVFDLIKSGKIEKLLNTSKSQPSKSKKEKVTAIKVIPELTGALSGKRKKCQSESPTSVKTKSFASAETTDVNRKGKITKLELESSREKRPPEAKVESVSALVICEKSKKRKISQLDSDSDNKLTSSDLTYKMEHAESRSPKTSPVALKTKKRKRSDLEQEENKSSKMDALEVKITTGGSLKSLKRSESNEDAKPAEPKKQCVKSTKDLASNIETVEKRVSKESPVKKAPVSEQKKSLEILQSVVPAKPSQTMGFRDFQSFRYDPSAADHEKFEIHDEEQQRQPPAQVRKEEKETQKLPSAEVKRFAEVDASVVDVFKAPADDAPFSLGALFGREESSDEEAESQTVLPNWKKMPKVVVNNDDDERYESKTESKFRVSKNIQDGFFYHSEDPRLKASKFCREKDLEELRAEWQEKRPHFVESYRMKKKKPLRSLGKVTHPNGKPHGRPTFNKGKSTMSHGFKKNRNHVTH